VLQFDSMQRAKEWLNCEEYREPRKMRHRTARTRMVVVEGVLTRINRARPQGAPAKSQKNQPPTH
jgi:hypothetical protein